MNTNAQNNCPADASGCNGNDVVAERTAAVVRGIASGNNACGALVDAAGRLNDAFVAASVRPTLEVYEREADELRLERARVSRESEERRQCLEFVHANAIGQLPREVADRVRQVLGYAAN